MPRAFHHALALCAAAAGSLSPDPARAQPAPPLLAPTPLVMRDERLVEVSVHTVPFEPGEVALTEDGIESLDALARSLATDCFLNAQAVGHAEPALADGPEPMAAHRIARSRAERVRAALMQHGLPEGSIAAFWDWQLAVREPRTTLWVFQLREGADCVGRRLQPAPEVVALVPQVPRTPQAPAAPQTSAEVRPETPAPVTSSVEEPPEPPPPVAAAAEPEVPPPAIEALEATEPEPPAAPAPPPAQEPEPAQEVTLDPPATVPEPPAPTAEPPPALSPAAPAALAPPAVAPAPEQLVAEEPPEVAFPFTTVVARLRPQPPAPPAVVDSPALPDLAAAAPATVPEPEAAAPAPAAAAAPPPAAAAPAEADRATADVEIVFDLNSSYLPRGAVPQLERLVERMPRDRGWKVVLTASVSAVEQRIPDQAAAQRYNRWLAERRLGRVADWLEQNSEVRDLRLVRSFAAADASRRVTVAIQPAS